MLVPPPHLYPQVGVGHQAARRRHRDGTVPGRDRRPRPATPPRVARPGTPPHGKAQQHRTTARHHATRRSGAASCAGCCLTVGSEAVRHLSGDPAIAGKPGKPGKPGQPPTAGRGLARPAAARTASPGGPDSAPQHRRSEDQPPDDVRSHARHQHLLRNLRPCPTPLLGGSSDGAGSKAELRDRRFQWCVRVISAQVPSLR